MSEYRFGDCDVVVPSESANNFRRGVVDRRQARAQLDHRLAFNSLDQKPQYIVEDGDLGIIESISAAEEQVGDAPKRFDALVLRAALYRFLELGNDGLRRAHGLIRSVLDSGRMLTRNRVPASDFDRFRATDGRRGTSTQFSNRCDAYMMINLL